MVSISTVLVGTSLSVASDKKPTTLWKRGLHSGAHTETLWGHLLPFLLFLLVLHLLLGVPRGGTVAATAPVLLSSQPSSQQALQTSCGVCGLSWDHVCIMGPITMAREMQFSARPGLSHTLTSHPHSPGRGQGGQRAVTKREGEGTIWTVAYTQNKPGETQTRWTSTSPPTLCPSLSLSPSSRPPFRSLLVLNTSSVRSRRISCS